MKICSGPATRVGDNCQNMLPSGSPVGYTDSKAAPSSLRRFRKFSRSIRLLFAVVLGCYAIAVSQQSSGATSEQKAPPKPSANPLVSILKEKPAAPVVTQELPAAIPEQPSAIPLPDVAARSLELGQMLRDAAATVPTKEQIDSIQTSIVQMEPDLQSKQELAKSMLAGTPNSLEIREEANFWRGMKSYTSDWEQQLLQWANSAQAAINMLDAQEPVWAATFEENKNNHGLGPVLTVISGNLGEIRKLRKQAQDTLQTVVNLQIKVGGFDQTADDVISQ